MEPATSNSAHTPASAADYPADAVIFFGVSLGLGIACRHLLRGTRVPYTVALLIIGIGLGALDIYTNHRLGKIGVGIRYWASIDPNLLLAVFLPGLLFESSFSMEIHHIKKCMAQMLLLAGPGVLISTFCLGSALKLTFPYGWSWKTSLLLGGLLSATDPVAVVALLKELGASKKLSTIIEGESLMNDGTAIVVFQLFFDMVMGSTFTWSSVLKYLAEVSIGAVGIGLAFGIASMLWLGFIFNDTVIEIALTLAVSYTAYFIAQEVANVSGVLTVMTLGMLYAAVAKTAFKGEGQQSLHHFWEMVSYIANTLIFILSGVVIAEGILGSEGIFHDYGNSWVYLVLLYVFVQVSRVIVVGLLFPFLKYFGYGLDWREAIILTWSGLRGAVALSLSLSVRRSSDTSAFLDPETGKFFVFFTGGIVFLTLVLNGSTTQFILHFLGMDKLSAAKKRIMDYTKYEMMNKALEAFADLGDDEEFGPVDWLSVKRYINTLNCFEESYTTQSDNRLGLVNVEDIRIRLLNGVQAAYWRMLDDGRITQTTANLLMQSVDEAIDRAPYGPLNDWNGLKDSVHFPSYFKFLQYGFVPPKLGTYFIVERLESACYICAAFLRAHRIARRQLHDFIGNNTVTSMIINESEAEGEEARMFLEDVRMTFPQVLRVVKTRQVAYSVLNHLIEYVQNLEQVGLLEQKEMLHLHDSVQTDLKRLLRNPPLVKIPSFKDSLEAHPLLGALPSWVHEPLANSTKDVMKLRGVPLYREGSKASGIWLICNGVVKWKSKSIKNKQSVHPTFTHGSTLGLYELLLGKPYLCDMITDSVVVCCFIEKEKIVSLLRTDPAIEDFLWQESAIVLAKILHPQLFETMPMQELRTLVAERSMMTNFLRGEAIEVPQQTIGFLLEGFIKISGIQEELITSPAALLPSHGNQHFRSAIEQHSFHRLNMSSGVRTSHFTYTGSGYVVETRARVIFFDTSSIHVESGLRRGSSSLLTHGTDHALSREHGGLMSWPEKRQSSSHQLADKSSASLSARAMQLSIFGSKVDLHSADEVHRSQSSTSFPEMGPNPIIARRLVSVRSEGPATATNSSNVRSYSTKRTASAANVQSTLSSDDESVGEEELIVRIDSPSRLSFRHPS